MRFPSWSYTKRSSGTVYMSKRMFSVGPSAMNVPDQASMTHACHMPHRATGA